VQSGTQLPTYWKVLLHTFLERKTDTLKTKAAGSSKYHTTRRHIPEDSSFKWHFLSNIEFVAFLYYQGLYLWPPRYFFSVRNTLNSIWRKCRYLIEIWNLKLRYVLVCLTIKTSFEGSVATLGTERYSTSFVLVRPDIISLQLCTPKVVCVYFKLYEVHNLHLR
jgi:hypothetical protein